MSCSLTRRGLLLALLATAALPGCGELSDNGPEAARNEWQRVGPVSVVVRSVVTRQLTGNSAMGAGYSKEPVCVVTLGFRVDEPGKEVQYSAPSASLRDEEGRSFRTVSFLAGVTLNERAPADKLLRTGESVADILLFEKEAAKARALRLRCQFEWKEKEGGAWKRKSGTARFKIAN